jgi:hypothetical protein
MVTFRSEFEPPWIGRAHVTALTVGRLAQFEVDWIIDQVIGSNPLPASIRLDIIERSDGIPLLVDETTKAVLEAGGQSVAEHAVAAVPPPAAAPATFHASLIARLDRLGPPRSWRRSGGDWTRVFASPAPGSRANRRRSCKQRSTISFGLVCCSGRVCRRTRPAPENQGCGEKARLLIGQAEAQEEPPESPLLLFPVLCGLRALSI